MTSKVKCPVCNAELHTTADIFCVCTNDKCKIWGQPIPHLVVMQLIQSQKDLKIARKANEEIKDEYETHRGAEKAYFTINWDVVAKNMYNYANEALEQIEHKE